ncbi:phage tail spike protein [Cytobacillus oceanisediminis]|uniref:phage tail spike protein n=1 Tax=Cytobacillus oceanisediminis TaxID=665099 RepID=UPI001FB3BB98|nr:phage tail spike protein [Cytobacillus oceanisediminis]UOE54915.1 phage tail protein [Cytobacillus oceanisediminis]
MIHILHHQTDQIIGWLTKVIEDSHQNGIKDNEDIYKFSVTVNEPDADKLNSLSRVLIPDEDGDYREFVINYTFEDTASMTKEVEAIGSFAEIRQSKIVSPQVLDSQSIQTAAGLVLSGLEWQVGIVDYSGTRKWTVEKHLDAYDALLAIASLFECELRFRVTTNGDTVTGRYVDFIKRQGLNRGKEITFGKDLIGIKRRVLSNRIVTALHCLGPERQDGTRLEVIVKNDAAYQNWNRKGKHRIALYEPETSDQDMTLERLTQLGEMELKKRISATVEYEVEAVSLEHILGYEHEITRLGDSAKIKDEHFNPPMYLDSRVIFVDRSVFNKSKKTFKLGEVIEYKKEDIMKTWRELQDLYATKVIKSPTAPPGKPNIIWIKTGGSVEVAHTWDSILNKWIPLNGSVTWIMYADDANGLNMSQDSTGKNYIGIAYNQTDETPSMDPADYTWSLFRGPQGVPGPTGENGQPTYTWIKYGDDSSGYGLSDNPTGKKYIGIAQNKLVQEESNNPADYTWALIQGPKGEKGNDGYTPIKGVDYFDGKDGQDGNSSYLHVRYSQNADGSSMTTDPTGAKYIGIATTATSAAPTANTSYRWSLIKGDQGLPGESGSDGRTSYLHIKYSNDGGATFTANNGETVGTWIGTYVDFTSTDSTSVSAYTWNKVKGDKGDKGDPGYTPVKGVDYFDGKDGANGTSAYLWVRYSQNANGNPMATDPTNAKYIGTAVTTTATAPTGYASYSWSLIKGTDGLPGEPGADGKTSYLHIKYSNDGGKTFTANSGETVGEWIGTYVDFNSADSTNVALYTWNKVKGETGAQGDKGDSFTWNLLRNGNFDKGVESWTGTGNGSLVVEDGRKAFKISGAIGISKIVWQSFAAKPNTQYTLSALLKVINKAVGPTNPHTRLYIEYYNNGAYVSGSNGISLDPSTSFVKRSATFTTISSGFTEIRIQMYVRDATGDFFFTDIMLSEEDEVPPYAPHPDDLLSPVISYNWVKTSNIAIDAKGNIRKSGGTTGWNEQAYTQESFTGGAFLSFKAGDIGTNSMFGLNSDPATDANYPSLDYAFYMNRGNLFVFENGSNVQTCGAYAEGDSLQITYDGESIRYYHNGELKRTKAVSAGLKLYIDSSITDLSSKNQITDIFFAPMGSKGDKGDKGVPGDPGSDGRTPYFHTAWATNSTGTAGFSTTVSTGKTYIGVYSDYTEADSTDPTKYSWSLIQGPKGDKGDTGDPGPQGPQGLPGGHNLCENGHFEDDAPGTTPKFWTYSVYGRVADISSFQQGNGSNRCMELDARNGGNADYYASNLIPVIPGQKFYVTAEARYLNTAGTNHGRIGFRRYNAAKQALSNWDAPLIWATKNLSFETKEGVYTVPSGCYYLQLWVSFTNNTETTNRFYVDNIHVNRMVTEELIVDGAILAKHIKSLLGLNVNDQFIVDNAGNVWFKGNLTGASGTFSGKISITGAKGTVTIENDTIKSEKDGWYVQMSGSQLEAFIGALTSAKVNGNGLFMNNLNKDLKGGSVSAGNTNGVTHIDIFADNYLRLLAYGAEKARLIATGMSMIGDNIISTADRGWIAPTLLNGVSNYGGGYQTAAYYKDALGHVHLRGFLTGSADGKHIFTLPAGYRPSALLTFTTWSNSSVGTSRISISTTGVVTATVSGNWLSLDGIYFLYGN